MGRIESTLQRMGGLEELAARATPAARLDPRAKLLATLAYVAAVASFGRLDLGRIIAAAALLVVAVPLADVPWRPILARLAIASPLALGVAAFEPFLDRAPLIALAGVSLSGGEIASLVILGKFALALGAALLLVATTGFEAVCAALGRLGVPSVVVSQLSLTHRYLFVLGEEAGRMVRAHELRAPGLRRPRVRTAGTLIGSLLLRALSRADRIHAAMRARGFTGRLPVRRPWRLRRADAVLLGGVLLAVAAVRWLDVPGFAGAAILGGRP